MGSRGRYEIISPNRERAERTFNDIVGVVQARFPELSVDEVGTVTEVMLSQIAQRLSQGDEIAFVRPKPDGTLDLAVLDLQVIERKK